MRRVSKDKVALFIGKFTKVYQFRCRNPQCRWEGMIFSRLAYRKMIGRIALFLFYGFLIFASVKIFPVLINEHIKQTSTPQGDQNIQLQ